MSPCPLSKCPLHVYVSVMNMGPFHLNLYTYMYVYEFYKLQHTLDYLLSTGVGNESKQYRFMCMCTVHKGTFRVHVHGNWPIVWQQTHACKCMSFTCNGLQYIHLDGLTCKYNNYAWIRYPCIFFLSNHLITDLLMLQIFKNLFLKSNISIYPLFLNK